MKDEGQHIPPSYDELPCEQYDDAGLGAGAEQDGLTQCATCGYSYSVHEDQPQLVEVAHVTHCPQTGEQVEARPTGERAWIVRHACGEWTWEDANFCAHCGEELAG